MLATMALDSDGLATETLVVLVNDLESHLERGDDDVVIGEGDFEGKDDAVVGWGCWIIPLKYVGGVHTLLRGTTLSLLPRLLPPVHTLLRDTTLPLLPRLIPSEVHTPLRGTALPLLLQASARSLENRLAVIQMTMT
ncbi:hypothetical protein Taro_018392 [Colocasia esculenta]|uniref:Uncharacterized protein n=1 Tax=Colocasia esculenta TaxID=4460 RepID=A0A843UW34_COLES|nr:hypothetical protein [Colocasia esculenta]